MQNMMASLKTKKIISRENQEQIKCNQHSLSNAMTIANRFNCNNDHDKLDTDFYLGIFDYKRIKRST